MKLAEIKKVFTVCKINTVEGLDFTRPFTFLSVTDNELSLVCPTDYVPTKTIERVDNWCCFRVVGTLEFELVGILAKISTLLAQQKISIFVTSTFDTDYILVQENSFKQAKEVLNENGYQFI